MPREPINLEVLAVVCLLLLVPWRHHVKPRRSILLSEEDSDLVGVPNIVDEGQKRDGSTLKRVLISKAPTSELNLLQYAHDSLLSKGPLRGQSPNKGKAKDLELKRTITNLSSVVNRTI